MTTTLLPPKLIRVTDKYPQVFAVLDQMRTSGYLRVTKTLNAKVPKMHFQFSTNNSFQDKERKQEEMIALKAQIPEADWNEGNYGLKFSIPIMVEEGKKPDLKELLMQLGNNLVTEEHGTPGSQSQCMDAIRMIPDNDTSVITMLTMWINHSESAQRQLDKLGFDWRM